MCFWLSQVRCVSRDGATDVDLELGLEGVADDGDGDIERSTFFSSSTTAAKTRLHCPAPSGLSTCRLLKGLEGWYGRILGRRVSVSVGREDTPSRLSSRCCSALMLVLCESRRPVRFRPRPLRPVDDIWIELRRRLNSG